MTGIIFNNTNPGSRIKPQYLNIFHFKINQPSYTEYQKEINTKSDKKRTLDW